MADPDHPEADAERPERGRDGERPERGRDGERPERAPDVFGDVLPDTTEDERGLDPGERDRDDDERILRERPPHW